MQVETQQVINAIREDVKTLSYYRDAKFGILGGLYTDETMRGQNYESVELINRFDVLRLIDAIEKELTK